MKSCFKSVLAVIAFVTTMGTFAANAQEETTSKPNVLIDYFWGTAGVEDATVDQLRSYVIEGIRDTKRVDLIDVETQSSLRLEKSRREAGVDADGDMDRLKTMQQAGANYIISGQVNSIAIEENTLDSGSKYYKAVLNYTLKCINPNDGKLVHSQSFKYGGELLNTESGDTPEEATMKACRSAKKDVGKFVDACFPVVGTVLEIDQVKKDEVKTCFISLGSAAGVNTKDRFSFNISREVAGRKSLKEIGEGVVTNVEGDDISVVEVKKGGKELKAALDGGQTIVVKSMVKKESILGGFKF